MNPSVWVVIVTWQTPVLTRALLEYLLRIWPEAVRVVLVECGPEVHELGVPIDDRVQVLRPNVNLGYAGGNNLGMRYALEAGASHVLLLNSDAFPLSGSLEHLVAAIEDDTGIGVCGGTLVRWTPDLGVEINAGTRIDWRTGRTQPMGAASEVTDVDFPCGAMVLYRREALERVGLLDSNLFLLYEEIDWCERARKAGFRSTVHSGARVLHLGSVSISQAPKAMAYYRLRNRLWILRRYGAIHGQAMQPSRNLVYSARVILGHMARGRFSLLWPAICGTAAGISSMPEPSDCPTVAVKHARFEAAKTFSVLSS